MVPRLRQPSVSSQLRGGTTGGGRSASGGVPVQPSKPRAWRYRVRQKKRAGLIGNVGAK
jgi:hypothetical protein